MKEFFMITSKTFRFLFIFSLVATFALKPMELSTEDYNPKSVSHSEQTIDPNSSFIKCHLKMVGGGVIYGDSKIHTDLRDNNKIESSLKDPLLHVKITALQKNKKNTFGGTYMYLPARLLKGLNDGSIRSIYFKNGSDFTFEDKPLQVFAKCRKGEKKQKLHGSTFAEQFNAMMNNFYIQPCVSIFCNREELKNAFVVSERRINSTTTTDAHGHNGISSKQAFENLIAEYELNETKNRMLALSFLDLEGI
jgi:hypothetical protein